MDLDEMFSYGLDPGDTFFGLKCQYEQQQRTVRPVTAFTKPSAAICAGENTNWPQTGAG